MTPDEEAREILDRAKAMTLACADADGPWATDVYFVRVAGALLFFSSPESRHSRALAADPRAAATVHGDAAGWRDIRGLQIEGRVEPVRDLAARARGLAAYLAKFPFAREILVGGGLEERVRLYGLAPARALWIDNGRGFGERTEVAL